MTIYDTVYSDQLEPGDRFIYDNDEVTVVTVDDMGDYIHVMVHDEDSEVDFGIEFNPYDEVSLVS